LGDVPTFESATDEYAECVGVDTRDACGGLDDTAGYEACLPLGQFGGAEGIGEDEIIQARDATKAINRDGAEFVERIRLRPASNGSGYLLSLRSVTLARSRTEHLGNGVCSDGGNTLCDGAGGKLPDGLLDFLNPSVVLLYNDVYVGVFVEDLADGDEVRIPVITTRGCGT
jgi:hypothetical protein